MTTPRNVVAAVLTIAYGAAPLRGQHGAAPRMANGKPIKAWVPPWIKKP